MKKVYTYRLPISLVEKAKEKGFDLTKEITKLLVSLTGSRYDTKTGELLVKGEE